MVGPTIQKLTVTKTELFENALQRENGEKTELFISTVGPTIQLVAVRLFSNRSQMTSKCGKNKAHEA